VIKYLYYALLTLALNCDENNYVAMKKFNGGGSNATLSLGRISWRSVFHSVLRKTWPALLTHAILDPLSQTPNGFNITQFHCYVHQNRFALSYIKKNCFLL